MEIDKEWVSIPIEAPFYANAPIDEKIANFWMVFHGYGQLAEHFIRRFNIYDDKEHHIVACQGLSRFYLDNTYQKVGASWMTRLEREADITHQKRYISAVYENRLKNINEKKNKVKNNFFAFSQGGATLLRWLSAYKPRVDNLILWAADLPKELTIDDFSFLNQDSNLIIVLGDKDPFKTLIDVNRLKELLASLNCNSDFITFDGGHHVRRDVLSKLNI